MKEPCHTIESRIKEIGKLVRKASIKIPLGIQGFSHCRIVDPSICTVGIQRNDYGKFRVSVCGKYRLLTRVMWRYYHPNEISEPSFISHSCDVSNCISKKHLMACGEDHASNIDRRGCLGVILLDDFDDHGIVTCDHDGPICQRVTSLKHAQKIPFVHVDDVDDDDVVNGKDIAMKASTKTMKLRQELRQFQRQIAARKRMKKQAIAKECERRKKAKRLKAQARFEKRLRKKARKFKVEID